MVEFQTVDWIIKFFYFSSFSTFMWAGYGSGTWGQSIYCRGIARSVASCGPSYPSRAAQLRTSGNGNGHRVSPDFHVFGPGAEGIWRKGLHSICVNFPNLLPASPPPYLDSIKLEDIP